MLNTTVNTASHGPRAGQGNPSELIHALDDGELAIVLLGSDERWHIAEWFDQQATLLEGQDNWLAQIVTSLADQCYAAKREQQPNIVA